jgi:hypothetical protein
MVVPYSHSFDQLTDIPSQTSSDKHYLATEAAATAALGAAKTKTNKELRQNALVWYRHLILWRLTTAFHEEGMQLLLILSRRRSARKLHESGCRIRALHNKADRTATVSTAVACSVIASRFASTYSLVVPAPQGVWNHSATHWPLIPHNILKYHKATYVPLDTISI